MKEERSQNVTIKNEVKGRGLFYGVIAVATFIIMAVGTTFAYFTATTNSTDTAVQTGSTTLKLKYLSYENAWMHDDLIPADTNIVEYSFEYQNDTTVDTEEENYETMRHNALCKDDYGNSICSVYVFQVENSANSPQAVSLDVMTSVNSFGSLNAMAYEIAAPTEEDADNYGKYFPVIPEDGTEEEAAFTNPLNGVGDPVFGEISNPDDPFGGTTPEGSVAVRDGDGNFKVPGEYSPVYVNREGVIKTLLKYNDKGSIVPAIDRPIKVLDPIDLEDNTVRIADNINIEGQSLKTFALVLYIKNEDRDQTESDASKTFSGKVIVGSGDGSGGVSGQIGLAAAANENLQSNQSQSQNG